MRLLAYKYERDSKEEVITNLLRAIKDWIKYVLKDMNSNYGKNTKGISYFITFITILELINYILCTK